MARKKSSPAPDGKLQRELWALALLALAVLLILSFIPPAWMGATGRRLFQTGNIVGPVGAGVSRIAWGAFGFTGFLLPVFPGIWAAHVLGRIGRTEAWRVTGLAGGILLLVPTTIFAFTAPSGRAPELVGWLGAAVGAPLTAIFGWLGAGLLLTFGLAAVCVVTLGWNPLRSMARGGRTALDTARRGVVAGAARLPRPGAGTGTNAGAVVDEGGAPDDALGAQDEAVDPWLLDEEVTLLEAPTASASAHDAAPAAATAPTARPRTATPPAKGPFDDDPGEPDSDDLPPSALLAAPPLVDDARNRKALDGLGQALVEKLATFRIESEIIGMTTGPVVTQFEVSPAPGIKVARIANLDADLALALRAPSVRIVAPIPGKGAVGVEVPNPEPQMVYFREVLEAPAFRSSKAQLPLALGKDIAGKPYVADLARMPHLLIAGATGSGKSVCVNTIVTSLIYRHSPRTLRLLMVDPKMVELSMYNDLPHLRHPVVTDNSEAAGVLKWAVLEMERRYALLSHNGVRNLQDFNQRLEKGHIMRALDPQGEEGDPDRWLYREGALPYIVLIIDELADLMMTVQGEVEKPLALLAQKARAIGIHLILATQRPSVNVLTGLIKANFPSRIGFRVSSKVDSRTILDQNGADNLLGNGDMLFLPPGQSDPLRIQGAFLSTEETEQLMDWYREQAERRRAEADGDEEAALGEEVDILEIVRATEGDSERLETEDDAADRDKLFREAAELCIQHQGGSTSLLQRRLRIGYGRAARIIDQLHLAGVLGPPDGSKPREVLVDLIQLDQLVPED